MIHRILVVGRNGQLAQELARATPPPGWSVEFVGRQGLDLSDPEGAAQAVRDFSPSAVINAAGYTAVDKAESEPELAMTVNAEAPAAMAAAAKAAGALFVQTSTDYVFGGTQPEGYREDDPVAPQSIYARSKEAGEAGVRAATDDHLIVRTSWLFGLRGDNFVKTMLRLGAERDELRIVDDQHGRPTSAEDLAGAVIEMLRQSLAGSGERGTFHFANAGPTTWRRFAEAIFARAAARGAKTPRVVPVTTADYGAPAARPLWSVLQCERIEQAFGIVPGSWEPALDATVEGLLASTQS